MRESWSQNTMHEKFPTLLAKGYIDTEQSFQWMKYSELKGEREDLVTAAQDQALKSQILLQAHYQMRFHI